VMHFLWEPVLEKQEGQCLCIFMGIQRVVLEGRAWKPNNAMEYRERGNHVLLHLSATDN
jgi:hypothetical protein